MLFGLLFDLLTELFTGHDLSHTRCCIFSNGLNVVGEMIKPESAQFFENCLWFIRKSYYKMSKGKTSAISDGPRFVLEAIEKCRKHLDHIWLERLFVNRLCNFCAKFRDAMACSFPHSMIVRLWLQNIVFANFRCIVANQLSSAFSEYCFPSFLRIDLDTLSHVVSVEAHPGDENAIETVP